MDSKNVQIFTNSVYYISIYINVYLSNKKLIHYYFNDKISSDNICIYFFVFTHTKKFFFFFRDVLEYSLYLEFYKNYSK